MSKKNEDFKIELIFQKQNKKILDELKIIFQKLHAGSMVLWTMDNYIIYEQENIKSVFENNSIKFDFANIFPFFLELEKEEFLYKIPITNGYNKTQSFQYVTTLKNFLNIKTNTLFIAREFNFPKSLKFYKKLKSAILETKIFDDIIMLEEQGSAGSITEYMEECIKKCEFFIADLSTCRENNIINPNVVYELGMARGFGKYTFQIIDEETHNKIKEKIKTLPFDIRDKNTVTYSNNEDRWTENIKDIINVIKTTYNKK